MIVYTAMLVRRSFPGDYGQIWHAKCKKTISLAVKHISIKWFPIQGPSKTNWFDLLLSSPTVVFTVPGIIQRQNASSTSAQAMITCPFYTHFGFGYPSEVNVPYIFKPKQNSAKDDEPELGITLLHTLVRARPILPGEPQASREPAFCDV